MMTPGSRHHRRELIARAAQAPSVGELFATASERLRRLVPFDSAVWLATDPATALPTAPTRTENMTHAGGRETCMRVWECEFTVEDALLYGDLARRETPAGALRMATRDRPARSTRYREYIRPNGFGDELRAVFRVDGSPWAALSLFRELGRPPFDDDETALVASLSAPLGEAVREHARWVADPPAQVDGLGPGLMVFARDGELISLNDDALGWLEELPTEPQHETPGEVTLPIVVLSTLMCARAAAAERDHRTARARIRSRVSGRWLVCHASCLHEPDGAIGNTALVIEPAKASEIAPIIVQAYELSPREQQITQLIAQGLNTGEIAGRLHLSAHTVRDYVKAVFDKVGVSSRGELVAKLFAEHYAPLHLELGGLEAAEQ